ncbi:DUF4393 domain-containing protein [Rummeliibacillus sp. TYF-LIM-RU47]|uniref:DUF4393 domain-containing protein n=1 Tax=Rummeliibacillus sp. TYF-LIM-RU47 TaxID=2608406 RepID=UPI001239E8A6|nr:DUF4393 domain-containing protein [Rummeliibacillus sp. TYF-LIM-RU47]
MKIEILPKFVDEAATPVAQSVGNSIAGVWNLVFGNHVSLWLKKQEVKHQRNYEDFVSRTNSKVESIPEENLKEPEMYMIGPAIEASKYYIDSEELREMFANLIAASVDSRINEKTHPSFVEIIKQLSPLDALILKNFLIGEIYPIARIKVSNQVKSEYRIIYENIMEFTPKEDFEATISSISNLQRLGLVVIDYNQYLTQPFTYDYIEQSPAYLKSQEYIDDTFSKVDFNKGIISITPLGRNFVRTCCANF